jgi:V/A-type H+-transporting ATPase subunit D
MTDLRVPPGRAGRLWLRHRLAVAERGVGLLEQKLRVLRTAQQRLHGLAERAERDWVIAAADADVWGLRAGLAGGQRALRMAAARENAEVHLPWISVMGVRYPGDASCVPPTGEPGDGVVAGNAAVVRARTAYDLALQAAVRHAATSAAVRVVDAEVATTRQRQRALRKHWIPRLGQALAELELALEEQDRAEAVRRRWAADNAGSRQADPPVVRWLECVPRDP